MQLWLFRVLLRAFPKDFRRQYGAGMVDLFRARLERAMKTRRFVGVLEFWLEILRDLSSSALLERLEQWGLKRHQRIARTPSTESGHILPTIIAGKRGAVVESIFLDVRQSIRRLSNAPGFAATTVLVVALGIGANTAIFSVVDSLLFRPLPWANPDQLVWIYQDSDDGEPSSNSYPAYRDMAAHTDVFSGVTSMINGRSARYLSNEGVSRQVTVTWVTSGYLSVLGLSPSRGRWFEPSHDVPGAEPVGVVSHQAWLRLFGGADDVVGRSVRLNGGTISLIGVGPEGYAGAIPGVENDFWLSISSAGPVGGQFYWDTLERRTDHWFLTIGRLRPGVSADQAQAAMNLLAENLADDYPDLNAGRDITVFPVRSVRQHPAGDAELFSAGAVLMGVVGLVLLIACGNLANLLLARASTRSREIAVRLALGATRRRLVQYLLTESVTLSLAGGVVGVAVAAVCGRLLVAFRPPIPLPITLDASVDVRVLLFAVTLSLFTGVLFGLAPALRASNPELVPSLKAANEVLILGRRQPRRGLRWLGLRNILVMGQVAVSIVLLVGAGLLVRSLVNAQSVQLGYAPEDFAVLEADVSEAGYEATAGRQLFTELRLRVLGLPGIQAVGLTTRLPTTASGGSSTLEVEGYQPATGTGSVEVIYAYVDTDYFTTLRIPVLFGRNFGDDDRANTERVAMVNETFALRYFGTADAVGRRYRHQGHPDSWVRIVGVVADYKVRTPDEAPTPMFFRPLNQGMGASRVAAIARTAGDPKNAVAMMRRELRAIDAEVPVYEAGTMGDHVARALAVPRVAATLLGVFGGLALLLASLGLYAVVTFVVSRRSTEMGIRVALGASGSNVFVMVVREMMAVVGVGVTAGLALSLMATPMLESILFGIEPNDLLTMTSVAGLLVVVALGASAAPARRAAHVDPMSAMRAD